MVVKFSGKSTFYFSKSDPLNAMNILILLYNLHVTCLYVLHLARQYENHLKQLFGYIHQHSVAQTLFTAKMS